MKKTYITPNAQVVMLSTGVIAQETLPYRASLHTNEENAKGFEYSEDYEDFEEYDDESFYDY